MVRRSALILPVAAVAIALGRLSFGAAPRQAGMVASAAAPDHVAARPATGAPTWVEMRNVDFHVANGVVLHIHRLSGEMRGRDGVVDFDDASSYATTVLSAEVALRGPDLTHLMNDHVFAYRGSPLRRLHVDLANGLVHQTGILHKGVNIPFELFAEPSLTTDGRILLHPVRIRIFGVNGALLLRALGENLEKMLDVSGAKGVAVQGNDLLLDATAVLPPPAIRGRLASVRVIGDELVQVFGTAADSAAAAARSVPPPDTSARNYMFYRGGTLHFTKLLMTDAEMLVVDDDERDPFDFDNPHYQRQLVAGDSRTLPDLGLEVHMPDARRLPPASGPAAPR